MFNFQHSQTTQNKFEKLVNLLLKYPTVYATLKFVVGKVNLPLHLPLKPDAIFKNKKQVKYQFTFMIK